MSSSDDEYEGLVRRSRVSLDKLDNQRYIRPAPPQPSPSSLITASSTSIPQLALHDVPVIPLAPAKPAPFLPPVWQSTPSPFTNPFLPDVNHDFSHILASLPPEVANADLSVAGDGSFIETTSALAARELKKLYDHMSGVGKGKTVRSPYAITAIEHNGKKVFRVSLRPSTDGPILPDLPEPASPPRPNSRRARLSVGGLLNQSLFRYTTGTKDLPHSSTSASSGRPRPSRRTLRRARSISDVPRTPSMLSPSVSGTSNADQDVFSQSSHSNIVFGRQSLDLSRGSTSELSEPVSDPYSAHDCLHLPFGEGVLYTEPPKPRNHSLPHSPRVVREMQSFESGLTAKADDNQPRAPMRQRQRPDITNKPQVLAPNTRIVTPYSTSVFDILQIYSGVPLPDTLSEDSNEPTVKLSSTLTVAPKDDPRFVIWGELLPGEEDIFQSTTDLSSGGAPGHRLSRVQNGDTLRPQEGLKTVIMAATIERWIAQLTSELNYEELLNFFLTYRTYISSIDLCHLLICRFHWALESPLSPNEETVRKIVRVRTFIAIRYWLITFFRIDFVPNAALCQVFSGWLNTLRRDPILVALPDALNIVRKLKKLCFECKTEYLATLRRPGNATNPTTANTPEPQPVAPKKYSLDYDETEVDLDMGQGGPNIGQGGPNMRQSTDLALAFAPFSHAMSLPAMHSIPMTSAMGSRPPSQKVVAFPTSGHSAQATPTNSQPMSASQVLLQQPLSNFILSNAKPPSHPATPAPSTHSTIHLQGSKGISRALVNMTGRLGRWKRVLSPRAAPMPTQLSCRGMSEFDLDINAPGDLLTIQGGVEQYLRLLNLAPLERQRVAQVEEVHPLQETSADASADGHLSPLEETPEADDGSGGHPTPLASIHIAAPPTPAPTPAGLGTVPEGDVNPGAEFVEEAPAVKPGDVVDEGQEPQSEDLEPPNSEHVDGLPSITFTIGLPPDEIEGQKSSTEGTPSPTRSLVAPDVTVESVDTVDTLIDERPDPSYDSMDFSHASAEQGDSTRMSVSTVASAQSENSFFGSSEEDYGVPTRHWFPNTKTIDPEIMSIDNMLSETDDESITPARRGPKRLPTRRDFEFIHRSASPSEISHQSKNRSSTSSHNSSDSASERQYIVGAGGIQAWHLDFIDSDDEEPGDVEAAMRRLEGQIDKDRQKHKEVKVDGWLRQVKKRLENGDDNSVSTRSGHSSHSSVAEADTSGDLAPEASASNANIPESMATAAISVEGVESQDSGLQALNTPQAGNSLTPTHEHAAELPARPVEYSSPPQSPLAPTFLQNSSDHPPVSQPAFKGHRPTQSLGHKQSFIKIGPQRPVISNKYTPSAIPPIHRSFILINRSQQLAEHFTMIERDLFMGIKFEDLVSSAIDASEVSGVMDVLDWNVYTRERAKLRAEAKKGIDVIVPTDLTAVEVRFYLMVKFTASEILLTQPQERPALVGKFIRLAFKCWQINNYSTLVAIITGLEISPVLVVMQKLWGKVNVSEMRLLEQLKRFASSTNNFRTVREAIANLSEPPAMMGEGATSVPASQSPTEYTGPSKGCIPFIGVYLAQLRQFQHLPDYVDPTAPSEPVEVDPTGTLSPPLHPEVFATLAPLPESMTVEPLINVHKQRLIAGVVRDVVSGQHMARKYNHILDRRLQRECLRLRALDNNTLHQLSERERQR